MTDFSAPPLSSPPSNDDRSVASLPYPDRSPNTRARAGSAGRPNHTSSSPKASYAAAPKTPASSRGRPASPSSEQPDYQSEYYTAAWGSPYAREISPSLLSRSARTAVSEQAFSDDFSNSSPGPSFSLEHLIPSRFSNLQVPVTHPTLLELPDSGIVEEDNDHTPRSRTKRWVQLPQRQVSGKDQWWSDESARSASEKEQSRAASVSAASSGSNAAPGRHKTREENRTLDQQSFWNIIREKRSGDMSSLLASRWAETPPPPASEEPATKQKSRPASYIDDKPLPEPPQQQEEDTPPQTPKAMEDSVVQGASKPEIEEPEVEDEQDAQGGADMPAQVPSEPTRLQPPRLRKRVSWRGKTCVISIPQLDYDALGLPKPLSSDELQQRLQSFENAGYNTRGFDVSDERAEGDAEVHARPIWPDETDMRYEATSKEERRVRLPDIRRWQDYMNQLTEAKLAALGVSLGGDDPAPTSGNDMSRQSSGQYPPLPFSPPIPTGSGASVGRPGMVRGHSHTMSMASPISPLNGPFGHMHRHSTFHGGFPGMVPPPQQQPGLPPRTSSLQGMQPFSPGGQMTPGQIPRMGSPSQLSALRTELGNMRGSGSPLAQQMLPQSPQDYSRNLMEDQRRRQHGYSQSVQHAPLPPMPNMYMPQQQQPRMNVGPAPLLPELPEDDDEEELSDPQPYVPPQKRTTLNEDIVVPKPRHRHNISEGLEREVLEAEQRRQADEARQPFTFGRKPDQGSQVNGGKDATPEQSQAHAHAEHKPADELSSAEPPVMRGHKKSNSRFNVDAPAFSFNPGASFQPGASSFTFGAQPPPAGHTRQKSSGSFNVAAPAFKPLNPPASDFSFAAKGPTFKPNAPVFEPPKADQSSSDEKPRIFGKVELPDVVKPARRSKAIAIVKPKEQAPPSLSGTDVEDAEGRIGRSEDKQKRARGLGKDDGDSVPQFAEPTPVPVVPSQPADKFPAKEDTAVNILSDLPEEAEEPVVEQVAEQAEKAVNEIASKADETVKNIMGGEGKENVPPAPSDKPGFRPGHKSNSSLSATAKPFVFQPSQPTEKPTTSQDKPSHESFASISELEEGEIREDEPLAIRAASPGGEGSGRDTTPSLSEPLKPYTFPGLENKTLESEVEPTFDEIDAIMQQMNEADTTVDTRAAQEPSPVRSPERPQQGVEYLSSWPRSDAPSPSPRKHVPFQPQNDSSFTIHERTDSGERPTVNGWPPVHRLNKGSDMPMSDWSDMLSPGDEDKIQQRSAFFDNRIDDVIGRVVERRLQPLEDSLRAIQNTVSKRARSTGQQSYNRQRSSSNVVSDADDEDDLPEFQQARPISRGRDQKLGQIKAMVLEALREQSPRRSQSAYDIADLHSALADMKVSFARAASASLELEDIRVIVEDVVSRQVQSQAVVPAVAEPQAPNEHRRHISELEGRLNETLAGALEEANHRHQVEEREAEVRRMLKLAEEEISLLRESSQDDDARVHALEQERQELRTRVDEAEDGHQKALEQMRNVEAENEAMQATLEEYRMSSTKWRQEIDDQKAVREDLEGTVAGLETQVEAVQQSGKREREELETTIAELREQLELGNDSRKHEREQYEATIAGLERSCEESQDAVSANRRRLEKLHSDMAIAAGQLADERAGWRSKEEEQRSRCEMLEAQNLAHARARVDLEEEIRMLRANARDSSESRFSVDHLRNSHTTLEEMVRKLQAELVEQQSLAARFERDFHDARESGRAEVHRTRMSMETDIEAANHQVNIVRAELESELARVRAEVDNVRLEADTAKERHALLLEEEADARREALRKVNHANSIALDDARHKYEAAIKDLTSQHSRALNHAVEDKERSEYFLNERLILADAKLQHFNDRVLHLEERLEVTKSAAQAAAENAKSKAAPTPPSVATATRNAREPERVSPQALRESILVLQEQLQERETRIEQMHQQLKHEGPAKLKERDTEIAWLRELLAVRSEELTDLVNTLSKPTFERESVRDTAIRIRANLQMEQQEKERQGGSLPGQALASLSNFATPKLSSAFNKWRTSMESSSLKQRPSSSAAPRSYTPSRPSSSARAPPAFSSGGLMTPPATNIRATPSPNVSRSVPAPRLSRPSTSRQEIRMVEEQPQPQPEPPAPAEPDVQDDAPSTPPEIFGEDNYDQDAEDAQAKMSNFGEADGEGDETLDDMADNEPPAFRSLEDELGPPSTTEEEAMHE